MLHASFFSPYFQFFIHLFIFIPGDVEFTITPSLWQLICEMESGDIFASYGTFRCDHGTQNDDEGEKPQTSQEDNNGEGSDDFVTFGTFQVLEDGNLTFGKFSDSEVKNITYGTFKVVGDGDGVRGDDTGVRIVTDGYLDDDEERTNDGERKDEVHSVTIDRYASAGNGEEDSLHSEDTISITVDDEEDEEEKVGEEEVEEDDTKESENLCDKDKLWNISTLWNKDAIWKMFSSQTASNVDITTTATTEQCNNTFCKNISFQALKNNDTDDSCDELIKISISREEEDKDAGSGSGRVGLMGLDKQKKSLSCFARTSLCKLMKIRRSQDPPDRPFHF